MEAQDRQAVTDALQLITSAHALLVGLLEEPTHQLLPLEETRIGMAADEDLAAAVLHLTLALESRR
jgi:hypothetical protein